jgi:hypothetical protein
VEKPAGANWKSSLLALVEPGLRADAEPGERLPVQVQTGGPAVDLLPLVDEEEVLGCREK